MRRWSAHPCIDHQREKRMYVVVFDDGRFLGATGKPVRERPDAEEFSSRRKADAAARKVNLESTVVSTDEE
jgi:hypothetical protein